jgi:hypothetical protein
VFRNTSGADDITQIHRLARIATVVAFFAGKRGRRSTIHIRAVTVENFDELEIEVGVATCYYEDFARSGREGWVQLERAQAGAAELAPVDTHSRHGGGDSGYGKVGQWVRPVLILTPL